MFLVNLKGKKKKEINTVDPSNKSGIKGLCCESTFFFDQALLFSSFLLSALSLVSLSIHTISVA